MLPILLADAAPAIAGGAFLLIIIGIVILASIFWIWMLIDCVGSSLPSTEKLIWTLVILFLHLLGAVLYYAIGRKQRTA